MVKDKIDNIHANHIEIDKYNEFLVYTNDKVYISPDRSFNNILLDNANKNVTYKISYKDKDDLWLWEYNRIENLQVNENE